MVELPRDLITAVQEGRVVLFLGAGASRGAIGSHGEEAPDGKALAEKLAKEFLGEDYADLDLRAVYDLACSERDVRTVQAKIFEILDPLKPAPFHKIIPWFPWAGLMTTNYDLIVERAYESFKAEFNLIPNTKDGDGATDKLAPGSILYVKLHGCITRYTEVDPPLVASTEQLITFKEGRVGQFDTFLEWAKNKTIVFCGYSFMDMNLRTLFNEVIKEGDKRPRHYIINKGARDAEISYWRDRRVIAIDLSFSDFMTGLDQSIPEQRRVLGAISREWASTSFSHFITTSARSESEGLSRYIGTLIEHVHADMPISVDEPQRFYSGFDLGWYSIEQSLDVPQPAVSEILARCMEEPRGGEPLPIYLIKGHAGSGKTVALRRICYEAAVGRGKLCFYVGREHKIEVEYFDEIFSLTNLPVYLFIDRVAEHRRELASLLSAARQSKWPLRVVAAETFNTWNTSCDDLESFVSNVSEMRYLSETSIERLLEKLEEHQSLGYLAGLTQAQRVEELKHKHGRQLLVALLEATHGVPLVNLIETEYRSIEPPEARAIYLDICSLHRFGPPVRAGIISRIHNISFDEFGEKFLRPLEEIVVLRNDKRSGDFVYEARHPTIADEVYNVALKEQEERFDNLIRIISKLNPGYSYDLEVIGKMIRAENLRNTLSDPKRIRQVYDVAEAQFGELPVIFHQRGIFEMHIASNLGGLAVADRWLRRALDSDEFNRAIKHSLAELDLRRSRTTEDPEERAQWRRQAVVAATGLLTNSTSPYPHHTLLKAAIDDLQDALDLLEQVGDEANLQRVEAAIAHAESTLRRGRQAFPNEAILLSEEGKLSEVLAQSDRAEKAFEKSFEANPRSTLIARRLARIKRTRGHNADARRILERAIEFNPSSRDLHYDLALTVMQSEPDSDITDADTVLHHLRRAFSPGDNNLQAQFWYARQLSLMGRFPEARGFFDTLAAARVPFKDKTEVRGVVMGSDGEPAKYIGRVVLWRETWGFVELAEPPMQVFIAAAEQDDELVELLEKGASLRFNLGFTLRGPVAVNAVI